jgi:hypothetical protein
LGGCFRAHLLLWCFLPAPLRCHLLRKQIRGFGP